jgi:hypothetical protein
MGVLTDIAAAVNYSELPYTSDGINMLPLCLARPNRFAVGFAVPTSSAPIITTINDLSKQSGVVITANGVLWFNIKDHGSLAQAAWFARPDSTLYVITVFEIVFPKEG